MSLLSIVGFSLLHFVFVVFKSVAGREGTNPQFGGVSSKPPLCVFSTDVGSAFGASISFICSGGVAPADGIHLSLCVWE